MTDERPAPLTPPECTMGGNEWFPLAHRRLRKSKWWRRASDMARARNVMLWGEAYDATPAGSLPDDDDELAEAAGFGMDVDAFLERKAEIMAPWTLCADGRWYHPTVCEVVLETWEKQSAKRKADADRKARSRSRVRSGPEGVTPDKPDVTRDKAEVTAEIATQREEERRGQEITTHTAREPTNLPAVVQPTEPARDWPGNDVETWCQRLCMVSAGKLDPAREPGLIETRTLVAQWKLNGFSFSLDVLPTVQRLCRKARRNITGWGYFNDAVREAFALRQGYAAPVTAADISPRGDRPYDHQPASKQLPNLANAFAARERLAALAEKLDGGGGEFD